MNIFNFFIFLIGISLNSYASLFPIRPLNGSDMSDFRQVCELFNQEDVSQATGCNTTDICRMISEKKKGIYVAESLQDSQSYIVGIVVVSYWHKGLTNLGSIRPWSMILVDEVKDQDSISFDVIATHQDFRRQGIAKNMMNYIEDFGLAKNIPSLFLSVYKDNESALACYQAQGYQIWHQRNNSIRLIKKIS
jgi:ribosomal protein S18 acetylase RimI-like enzyme